MRRIKELFNKLKLAIMFAALLAVAYTGGALLFTMAGLLPLP